MPATAPHVYRTADVAARTTALLEEYTAWNPAAPPPGAPAPGPDLGEALVQVFAHLAGVVADRLNQVPDKNFLAFLDLVGVSLRPPRPARVPLTFSLAPGVTGGAVVPAGTRTAADPLPGETEPILFETERELFAIAAAVAAVRVRDPLTDTFAVRSADAPFALFEGSEPILHRLYVGASALALAAAKRIDLAFGTGDESATRESALNVPPEWLRALDWEYWSDGEWRATSSAINVDVVSFDGLPPVQATEVGGIAAPWLRATLRTSLPRAEGELSGDPPVLARQDVPLDALRSGVGEEGLARAAAPFPPFPSVVASAFFGVACEEAFSKPGAEVVLQLGADAPRVGRTDMTVAWEYSAGDGWAPLVVVASADGGVARSSGPTRAFVDDGTVSFTCPGDWIAGDLDGAVGFWMRARIVEADYTAPAPPTLRSLATAYTWELPFLRGITIRADVGRKNVRPELAVANQTAIDLNKDFAPFGATPQLNDALYLANDEVLAPPSKTVAIHVAVTNSTPDGTPPPAAPSPDLTLRWEFWDGALGEWASLGESGPDPPAPDGGFSDTTGGPNRTGGFVVDGTITFTTPATIAPVEVNGIVRHWLRVRIVRGDYGHPPRYAADTRSGEGTAELVLEPGTLAPPSIASLRIDYDQPDEPPVPADHLLTENDFATVDHTARAEAGFVPFTPSADLRPTLYLGFDQPLPDRTTSLYVAVDEVTYTPETLSRAAELEPPVVTWEYWDGDELAWQHLSLADETRALTRPGLVTFIGPPALARSREFGVDAHWLRARWDRGGYPAPPRTRRFVTNTTWAMNATRIENEILGSSTGEPGQSVQLTGTPVLEGEEIEIRESELPSPPEVEALRAEAGGAAVSTVVDDSGRPVEIWVRWSPVLDFYGSGPRSRHYVVDRISGVVNFGDGRRGLIPPAGRSNIRAARYQHGGGQQGNRAAGTISQLKSAVPYVQAVTNVEPARGGTARETTDGARERGPRELRHGGRAVAVSDFEDLALEASTEVARVLPIPVRRGDQPGQVGLVVVARSDEPQPVPSLELLNVVQDAVAARAAPTFTFWVAGPGWIEVTIVAEVVPTVLEEAAAAEAAVVARLTEFLHPLTGGLTGTGWPFGRRPHRSDLHAQVEAVAGIDHVRALTVIERIDRPAPAADASLVYSGKHAITAVGGE